MKRLARCLLIVCSAASLLLCVAVCVLWGRSYRTVDVMDWSFQHTTPGWHHWITYRLQSGRGRLTFGRLTTAIDLKNAADGRLPMDLSLGPRWEQDDPSRYGSPGWYAPQFYWEAAQDSPHVMEINSVPFTWYRTHRNLRLPYWLVFVLMGLGSIPAVRAPIVAVRNRRRSRVGHCRKCGYDLRATRGRCPECGTAAPSSASSA